MAGKYIICRVPNTTAVGCFAWSCFLALLVAILAPHANGKTRSKPHFPLREDAINRMITFSKFGKAFGLPYFLKSECRNKLAVDAALKAIREMEFVAQTPLKQKEWADAMCRIASLEYSSMGKSEKVHTGRFRVNLKVDCAPIEGLLNASIRAQKNGQGWPTEMLMSERLVDRVSAGLPDLTRRPPYSTTAGISMPWVDPERSSLSDYDHAKVTCGTVWWALSISTSINIELHKFGN